MNQKCPKLGGSKVQRTSQKHDSHSKIIFFGKFEKVRMRQNGDAKCVSDQNAHAHNPYCLRYFLWIE